MQVVKRIKLVKVSKAEVEVLEISKGVCSGQIPKMECLQKEKGLQCSAAQIPGSVLGQKSN